MREISRQWSEAGGQAEWRLWPLQVVKEHVVPQEWQMVVWGVNSSWPRWSCRYAFGKSGRWEGAPGCLGPALEEWPPRGFLRLEWMESDLPFRKIFLGLEWGVAEMGAWRQGAGKACRLPKRGDRAGPRARL